MKRFIEGEYRGQGTLLPELLDDYVAENNPVRVVDVFVDELDLGELGFERVQPAKTEPITQPCYSSSTSMATSIVSNQAVGLSAKRCATSS